MISDVMLYISLKQKPLTQSEIIQDKPEWIGNSNLTIERFNIAVLYGFKHDVLKQLIALWRAKRIALVDVPDGAFAYALSGKQPRYPMANDWRQRSELHWRPILIYSDDLLWRNLRRRRLTWENVLPYERFIQRPEKAA